MGLDLLPLPITNRITSLLSPTMSASISSRSRDHHWRSDRSIVSHRSHTSTSRNMPSKRCSIEEDNLDDTNGLYLPANLLPKSRISRVESARSLQELDATVATASKGYALSRSPDTGETAPIPVLSYEINAGRPAERSKTSTHPTEEKAMQHLTKKTPPNINRVESSCGRSRCSRSSRSSRGSKSSRTSKRSEARSRRRADKLERQIYQTILNSESELSESSYSTKECSDTACRSAGFILTDLFQEAAKSMRNDALPYPVSDTATSAMVALTSTLPPRNPDHSVSDQGLVSSSFSRQLVSRTRPKPKNTNARQEPDDPFADLGQLNQNIGVIKEAENESESSSSNMFEPHKYHLFDQSFKCEYILSATSDSTGLNYSLDGDSLLQYSSTNGTSTLSCSQSFIEKNVAQKTAPLEESFGVAWTNFGENPFKDSPISDDFGFGSFHPFHTSGKPSQSIASTGFDSADGVDLAWDTSKDTHDASPDSPSSVFNFFPDQGNRCSNARSDTMWDTSSNKFDFSKAPDTSSTFWI